MNPAAAATTARVSVLVPTFNRADLLGQALDSLLAQTIQPQQILVIDDGSLDGTQRLVHGYGDAVEYLRKDNGGKASALNLGMTRVTGDFVWVFDDDDVALPTSIADHLEVFERQPDAGIVIARHYWGTTEPSGEIRQQSESVWPAVDEGNVRLWLMHGCFTMLQGALIRTSSLQAVGPYREELLRSQDYDMLLRLVRRFPIGLLPKPTYIHRRHAGVRGPATIQHPASERERVWSRYDAMIGRSLREELAIGEYLTPPTTSDLTPAQMRAGLLNRMSVMASKGLCIEMLEDAAAFAQACANAGVVSLTAAERRLALESVLQGYFPLCVVTQRAAFVEQARGLAALPVGRALLRAFARGLTGMAWWGSLPRSQRISLFRIGLSLGRAALSRRGAAH